MKTVDTAPYENHTIPDLFKRLRNETTTLLRQEVELAKTEMTEKAAKIARNIAAVVIGGSVAYTGLIFLLLGATRLLQLGLLRLGLAEQMATWVAPLAVGIVVAAIGYGLIQKATGTLKRQHVTPEVTVQTLQENKAWLKQKIQ